MSYPPVASRAVAHVEPARSKAYDQLGDGQRAMNVALRWLRPKVLGDDHVIDRD